MDYAHLITIDRTSDLPFYLQIHGAIKTAIQDQVLKEHDKLPPIRKLAAALSVNNGTIVNAYRQLETQKLIYSKPGSGNYVAVQERAAEEDSYALDLPHPDQQITVDFTGSSPEPDLFPVATYKRLVDLIIDREGGYAFQTPDAQGHQGLRQALVGWLASRSIVGQAQHIHITSGSQQSLDIISKVLIRPKDYVAVESPVYPGALATFVAKGAKVMEIPLKADGVDLKELKARIKRHPIRFFYTMPCFQNPSGVTWTLQKKRDLLALARQYDFYVLEDDFLSEFSYGSKNIQTLKELDTHHRVIYMKSIAKLLMPGMRLGFMLSPSELNTDIRKNKYLSDLSTAGLSQRVLDLYLRSDQWAEAFKAMNTFYRKKYLLLLEEVDRHFPPEVTFIPPQGGFSLWFTLPEKTSSKEVAQRALEQGIRITPGHAYYLNQQANRHFRLAFAKVSPPDIRKGVRRLASILNELC